MAYDNIMNAIRPQLPESPKTGLSLEERAKNYQLFDELMKKGISLEEVLKQADEKKNNPGIDTELFQVMEDAVKEDDKVTEARHKAATIKAQVITEMCLKDTRYREALEEYHKVVSEVYVKAKESLNKGEPLED